MKSFIKWFKQQVIFREVNPVIKLSAERMLQLDDLASLPEKDQKQVSNASLSFESSWKFIKSMLLINRKPILWGLFFTCFRVAFALSIPVIIKLILGVITSDGTLETNILSGVIYSCLFAGATILSGIVINQCFYWDFIAFQAHQRLLDSLIFRQMLQLSPVARSKFRAGDVINRVGNDSQTISKLGFLVNDLFYVVILFIGVITLLLNFLGVATFAALGTLIIFKPIAGRIAKNFENYDSNKAELRETRLNLISQMLTGIRTTKLYNLTELLESKICKVRSEEVKHHISWGAKSAMSIVVFGSTTTLVCLAAFGTRVVLGQPLDPTVLFPSLGLLMLLEVPFAQMPEILSNLSSIKVAGQRILDFLKSDKSPTGLTPLSDPGTAIGVNIENLSLALSEKEKPILNEVNLSIQPGEAVAIVGSIGSGKSVFLRTLLEADERLSGAIKWNGIKPSHMPRIAYVPQEAFLFNETLKENLLMGNNLENSEDLLQRALEVTDMEADVRQFPGGLMMEIGERGVGLSGGQKQRISLARAVMSQPGVAILDDPFSALDGKTEERIMERLIFSEWNSITRIVATHRLRFLHQFDKVVFLKDGIVAAQGTLDELLSRPDFKEFYSGGHLELSFPQQTGENEEVKEVEERKSSDSILNNPLRIVEDEERRTGHVGRQTYGAFLNAMGGGAGNTKSPFVFAALIITMFFAVITPLLQNLWFVVWSDPSALKAGSVLRSIAENPWQSMFFYAGIGVIALVVIYFQRALWNRQAAVASGVLHDEGLAGVVRAPIRFFDSTPSGVILNRFSRDVFVIENDLRWMFENMVRFTFQALVNLILILIVGPWIILGVVPILWLYYRVQKKFSIASREVKRLVQVAQSPVFSHLRETFDGILTIRTLECSGYFSEKFSQRHSAFQRASRAHELIDRWFSVRVPVLSGGISLISALSIFIAARYDIISTGLAGIILTYLIGFWTLLNWSARTFAMVEGNLTSVERLVHLSNLPNEEEAFQQEEHRQIQEGHSYEMSESKGASIEFVSASVRYAANLPDVLKNVSFKITPGSQVGIVGRTGSGKSTILQALVGMAEVSSGDILIDGVSIRNFSLKELRKIVAVVPQEPFLLNDTIRMNLDPVGKYSDAMLMDALNRIGLGEFMVSQTEGLDTMVSETGGNLSQGQKQLLCFARALLRKPKIIIMDEATSNVDIQTESRIQSGLKAAIDGITVLTIAHRTSTITDSDQIIRLSSGELQYIS
ncbi:ATP-binding cassette domain-containing protein [Bacillus thuringiensis]|uniref:ATP-binding cassette domain-containing protein n=1 Tax=Bacillus thuringiensis TaxID=1428 RepID=UPI0033948D10